MFNRMQSYAVRASVGFRYDCACFCVANKLNVQIELNTNDVSCLCVLNCLMCWTTLITLQAFGFDYYFAHSFCWSFWLESISDDASHSRATIRPQADTV